MALDKALQLVVTVAWDDLMKAGEPRPAIDPPAPDDREEAVSWINQIRGSDASFASAAH